MSDLRKAPGGPGKVGSPKTSNQKIAEFLFELANYERNVNREMHKYNAYRKAASAVSAHGEPIRSGDQALKIPGVGKKIAAKIDEFLSTGKLKKLEKIRADDTSQAINLLNRVAGIGPAKARELFEQGITSIEELRKHGDKLNKAQKIGLKHFEDFEERIPREEIKKVEKFVAKELNKLDPKFKSTICGSYRRGQPSSGDVDVLLTYEGHTSKKTKGSEGGKLLKSVVEALTEAGLITDVISHGDVKFAGVCKAPGATRFRRLDLRLLPSDQFYCGVLYFTGSDQFNKHMRSHALDRGFTLNEYTLRPVDKAGVPGKPLPVSSEEDIFDYISYQYKKPEERNM